MAKIYIFILCYFFYNFKLLWKKILGYISKIWQKIRLYILHFPLIAGLLFQNTKHFYEVISQKYDKTKYLHRFSPSNLVDQFQKKHFYSVISQKYGKNKCFIMLASIFVDCFKKLFQKVWKNMTKKIIVLFKSIVL